MEQINFPLEGDEHDLQGPVIWRLFGISGFASAAGVDDEAHAGFEQPGQELAAGITRINVDLVNESLEQLSVVCGEIGR